MQFNAAQCSSMLLNAVQCCSMQFNAAQCSSMLLNAVQCCSIQSVTHGSNMMEFSANILTIYLQYPVLYPVFFGVIHQRCAITA
jgi:hypothetical protein